MARVLIVGCGCRGRALAASLIADGHAVRATTRDPARLESIAAVGAEGVIGDPDRIVTLMGALDRVTVVCWLLGSATGDPEGLAALHSTRLRFFLERLIDTTVRGVVYEAVGTLDPALLAGGSAEVVRAHETWAIPVEIIDDYGADPDGWLELQRGAISRLISE
ncbi:MAG: NAD(P)H-binding protein [Actinomycetota bacterium]